MTTNLQTSVKVRIRGFGNSWSVDREGPADDASQDRLVELEIEGNARDGFHLIMSPEGCFTADAWFPTLAEALQVAEETFGIRGDGWKGQRGG